MSETLQDYEPVKVQIAGSDIDLPGSERKQVYCKAQTIVLTTATPTDQILDRNPKRLYALLVAATNATNSSNSNIIIAPSQSEAQGSQNTAAGQPQPVGFILGYGNTTPTKIPGGQAWWATAAVYPSQISVLTVEVED